MLDIVICEDNDHLLKNMVRLVEKTAQKNQLEARVVFTANNPALVEEYIKDNPGNVFFLDIDLKAEESGYSLAKKIRQARFDSYIIFASAHLEYLMQAFKIQAFDFLPKPVNIDALEQTLLNIDENYRKNLEKTGLSEQYIQVKNGSNIMNINLKEIVFIEKELTKTAIHLVSSTIFCKLTLEYFENNLLNQSFKRCHRAYIANKAYISEIHSKEDTIIFKTGHTCFIGRKYKKDFIKEFQ